MQHSKPDLLKIFRNMRKIVLRQELAEFNRDYFVDEHLTDLLCTNNWQVLYGRRGTGKTTNLFSLADYVNNSNNKSLAIYIDLSRSTPSDLGASTASEAQRIAATRYFQDFVNAFCKKLFDCYVDSNKGSFFKNLILNNQIKLKEIEDIVIEIASLSDGGKFTYVPEKISKNFSKEQGFETKISAKASPENLGIKTDLGSTKSKKYGEVQTFIAKETGRYHTLSEKLEEFCEILNLDTIYVLIDEWTSMDKSGKFEIQPLFAELLNRVFKQVKGISVKISTIRGTTVLFRQDSFSQIGLEIGEDIYEAEDLDVIHANNDGNNIFFEKLIYKKMIEANPDILFYSKKDENGNICHEPIDGFIRSLFKEENLFDMLVEASGRIPRLFIEMFTDLYSSHDYKPSKKMDRKNILNKIVRRSIIKRQSIEQQDRFKAFYSRACEIAQKTNQRIFFISRNQSLYFSEIISDLFHFKMIHNVNQYSIPVDLDSDYRIYTLDYGTYLHVTGKFKKVDYYLVEIDMNDEKYTLNSEQFIIQASDIDLNTVICDNCDRAVVTSHIAVINAKVCYHCFHKLKI